jgi:hypothetical protein
MRSSDSRQFAQRKRIRLRLTLVDGQRTSARFRNSLLVRDSFFTADPGTQPHRRGGLKRQGGWDMGSGQGEWYSNFCIFSRLNFDVEKCNLPRYSYFQAGNPACFAEDRKRQ